MHTVWDWATLGLFCALAVLFLQRSVGPAIRGDHILHYVPPALGCAAANWLGNAGHDWQASGLLVASAAYVAFVLLRLRG
jgi:hypothetical protein